MSSHYELGIILSGRNTDVNKKISSSGQVTGCKPAQHELDCGSNSFSFDSRFMLSHTNKN